MRLAWLAALLVVACDAAPKGGEDAAADGDGDPPKPASCPQVCEAADYVCFLPDEPPSDRCRSLCYWGTCCYLLDGSWKNIYFQCPPPVDAGVDAADDAAR